MEFMQEYCNIAIFLFSLWKFYLFEAKVCRPLYLLLPRSTPTIDYYYWGLNYLVIYMCAFHVFL